MAIRTLRLYRVNGANGRQVAAAARHRHTMVAQRRVLKAPAASSAVIGSAEKAEVQQLLSSGQHSFYSQSPAMSDAITRLLEAGSPTLTPGDSVNQGMGVGTWQARETSIWGVDRRATHAHMWPHKLPNSIAVLILNADHSRGPHTRARRYSGRPTSPACRLRWAPSLSPFCEREFLHWTE